MAEHNELGKIGENLATEYLIKNGFEIVVRNWRYRKEEIDIIAMKDDLIIFVEVKTRDNEFFATPANTVTTKKQKLLIRAADEYIKSNEVMNEGRFDIIFIIHNTKYTKIDHIEDAFYATT